MYNYANENMQNSIGFLNENVCVAAPDPEGCKKGVETWWPKIQPLIFNDEASKYVCRELNNDCEIVKNWDCNTCINDAVAVAKVYQRADVLDRHVEYLSGEMFCQGMDLEEELVVTCQGIIELFIPIALRGLFMSLEADANNACAAVFEVCEPQTKFWIK